MNNCGNKDVNLEIPPTSERQIQNEAQKTISKKPPTLRIIISIISVIIVLVIVIILIIINRTCDYGKPSIPPPPNNFSKPTCDPNECKLTYEEAIECLQPTFKITSKPYSLNQILMKSSFKHNSVSFDNVTTLSVFTKAKYDIYTLNESIAEEKDKDFYSKKYFTVVTINSLCIEFSDNKTECELKKYLDLNLKYNNNLRGDDKVDPKIIEKVILPICIFEHTDSNIILSITCPDTLSSNIKNMIIYTFRNIKSDSIKGMTNENSKENINITEKDNNKYINLYSTICDEYEDTLTKGQSCNITKNIVTDSNGNFIFMKKNSTSTIIKDKDNHKNKIKLYFFEDISQNNTKNFDPDNYKKNLDLVFELIKPYMKKDDLISQTSFNDLINEIMFGEKGNSNSSKLRNLEENEEDKGVINEPMFSKEIYDIKMSLNKLIDLGLEYGANSRTQFSYQNGNETQILSLHEENIRLFEIMNKYIEISKSSKSIASSLQKQLNQPLLEIRDYIDSNIKDLNNLLVFNDLSSIFDSTLSISQLTEIPYSVVSSVENLYSKLNKINNDIFYSINDNYNNLKQTISSFLLESHNLIFNIFSNLSDTSNSLSSIQSRIAEISSYYLNYTDSSYIDIIGKAKDILSNYYINEKKLIEPLVDQMLNQFYNESISSIEKLQTTLEIIRKRLENGELTIKLGNEIDKKKLIDNINNIRLKSKEIISNIVKKLKESLNLQYNGYFLSSKEIDYNNKSFGIISEDALKIANILDNNLLIDKTFDEIMIYFRDQFIVILKYIENIKREKFPLQENILGDTFFSKETMSEINRNFDDAKINILNRIRRENNEYLEYVNEKLTNFKKENVTNLEQYISNIQLHLSDLNLDNLNAKYNESLNITINSINNIIEDNKKKAIEYFTNVNQKGTCHITSGYKNKYLVYINNINKIRNYIQLNLKTNIMNKYKNVITQIRSVFQKIKLNTVIKDYFNHLPFSEAHLRVIETLFIRLDKYISDSLFNQNYLTIIDDYISNTIENLNNIEKSIDQLYNKFKNLQSYSSNSDTTSKGKCDECCVKKFLFVCINKEDCCTQHYDEINVKGTNNHLNLINEINIDQYTKQFDDLYSDIFSEILNNTNNYIDTINILPSLFDSKESELLERNISYLYDFYDTSKSVIINYLDTNILNISYNYFQNELSKKIPIELENILDQWSTMYDKVEEDLNSNLDKFKYNLYEFFLLGNFYYTAYKNNITYEFVNSIVDQRKNEFNYTIKFYYNLILSKVNKTYSYIINNIPVNDKPFDKIIYKRIVEITKVYNNIVEEIELSKNRILNSSNQLSILEVKENNFFLVNDFIKRNIEDINRKIPQKYMKFSEISSKHQKEDSEENFIAKLYLENSVNGKQIPYVYEPINKATFIELQNNVYQKLIEEIWEIEQDELIKKIKYSLKESNENLTQYYKYEKDKYAEIIQNKIYNEFYTKEDLEMVISTIYTNGVTNLNVESKNETFEYLDEILNNIKKNINNEVIRLNSELTSYSNNYTVIEETLNNYKKIIYEQFYSTIVSVNYDFYNQIKNKFYTNYIEKNFEVLIEYLNEEQFSNYSFLNITFDLKQTMNQTIDLLINEYKNLAMTQIEYLYNKNLQNLDLLFSFSTIKDKINNEITNIYNSVLLPALKVYGKYNSSDYGVSDYDFPKNVFNNIDLFLYNKTEEIKEIVNKMKGPDYIIKEDWEEPDFSKIIIEEFIKIQKSFNNFTNAYNIIELKQFKDIIFNNINNNYNIFLNTFVPSFGKDFFDRILKHNEIQKIKSLYNNLKLSLVETLIYYIGILSSHTIAEFPSVLKNKILSLNNLDSIVKKNNEEVLSRLNSKIDTFFDDTKKYLVKKYISQMKIDPIIIESFKDNNKIKTYIEQILDEKRYVFEDEYINMMNSYIKNPFMEKYSNSLNKDSKDMLYFLEENKEVIRGRLNKISASNSDEVLFDIDNKLNNILKAIDQYYLHFNSFNIPNEIKEFLDRYVSSDISPQYEDIFNILDEETKDLIVQNLNENSENFKNAYSLENFESKLNEIISNLTNNFNIINEYLNSYGTIESKYTENLDKEITKYNRIRRLDILDDEKKEYNQNSEIKLDDTFDELINVSLNIKQFIESFNLFSEFGDKVKKYMNNINIQYGISQNNIKENKDYYDLLNNKLCELKEFSIQYYTKANSSYFKTKESIQKSIDQIKQLIEKCSNVTYETISKKYVQIKNSYIPIDKINKKQENIIDFKESFILKEEETYIIKGKIEKYIVDNEISFDIIFEEGNIRKPKVIVKIIDKNKPQNWEIDFYSLVGNSKSGRKMRAQMNNVSLIQELNFNGDSNEAIIKTTINFEEYNVRTEFYESRNSYEIVVVGNIEFTIISPKESIIINLEGENENVIIPAKTISYNKTYTF